MTKENPKILIVDDEPDICSSVQSYFGKRGIIVSTTGSGQEALSMIKSSKPDIILLDITLEDLNGVEVLEQLRKFDKETKVVIITGQAYSEEQVKEIISLGVTEYVNKPLILNNLSEIIFSILGNRPLPTIQRIYKRSDEKENFSAGSIVHKLANHLANIRTPCKNFADNLEDGIYKDKTESELLKMSTGIMRDVINTVDRMADVIDQIKQEDK